MCTLDNVLLASELVQGYNNNGTSKRGMLKIDLRKAFDSIEWSFILDILVTTRFPARYIHWISQCIKTTRFSIAVNGELCGYFKGKKGLRQGDPLSSYLFVIGMDVFSRLLDLRFQTGQIGYHPRAANPDVTHLIFVDDIMLFFDGETASVQAIVTLLEYFTSISGLVMNKTKTELYLSGSSEADQRMLCANFGFTRGSLPVKYLGLPLLPNPLSRSDCEPLVSNIRTRLHSWQNKHLLYAGRLQLLASVIQNIIAYWCAAFILPAKCIKDIEKLCRRFLWSGSADIPKQAKVSWRKVCSPKEEGGLGLQDLREWNKIFGLKLIWDLFFASGSLWVAWCRKRKLGRKCFWRLSTSSDGKSCSFWYDKWTPFGDLITFLGADEHKRIGLPLDSTVAQAHSRIGWIIRGARTHNMELLLTHLSETTLFENVKDIYLWAKPNVDPQDRFGFSDTWNMCRLSAPQVHWHKQVWFTCSIPKQSFIMWFCCLDRMPTLSRLRNWGIVEDDTCHLCEIYFETKDHLFLRCPYSFDLWRWCLGRLQMPFIGFNTWERFLLWLKTPSTEEKMNPLKLIAAQAVIYSIWHERNARKFTGIRTPVEGLFAQLDRRIRNTCSARHCNPKFQDMVLLWFRTSTLASPPT
ncbi:PREDICTED: uncharacterized protein LOC104760055 [Camelina sativa]|uniref:Uncharacterized protein LOC104760055 n=1 Tax=Camelina sativa TaxID=90675 RepID=A0ABM0X5U9_CAMSA|nr:PREDICTED: uncharacterized protein LOC104760055 [Camelina sativa]